MTNDVEHDYFKEIWDEFNSLRTHNVARVYVFATPSKYSSDKSYKIIERDIFLKFMQMAHAGKKHKGDHGFLTGMMKRYIATNKKGIKNFTLTRAQLYRIKIIAGIIKQIKR